MAAIRLSTVTILRIIKIASPKGDRSEEVTEEYRNQTRKQVDALRLKWADKPDVAFDVIPQIGRRENGAFSIDVGGQVSKDPKIRDRRAPGWGVPLNPPTFADIVKDAA